MWKWLVNWTLAHVRTIYLKYGLSSKCLSCKTMITTGFGHLFWDFCSSVDTPKNCVWAQSLSVLPPARLVLFPATFSTPLHPLGDVVDIQKAIVTVVQLTNSWVQWRSTLRGLGAVLWIHLSLCLLQMCRSIGSTAQQRLESENKWWLCWCVCYMLMEPQANAWPLLCYGDTTETRESH